MAKRLGILFFICATGLLAVTAYWLLFTTFMGHDDEGYVLISLKNYSAQGGLYAHVFSQYGPFFYFVHDAGHRLLGYEFTNTSGRFITLGCWMVAAGASAHLVWRQTHAVTLTGFTLCLTAFHLWLMVGEPIHPGGMIAAMVALGAWMGTTLISRQMIFGLAVFAGLMGAALLLTKINVGLFFLLSTAAWFVIQLRDPKQARFSGFLMGGLLILLPVGLMLAVLSLEWGRTFAGLSVVASVTMLLTAWHEREPLTNWRHASWGGIALLLLSTAVVGIVCLRGTSLKEMLDGVLLAPLKHPGVYRYPPFWRPGATIGGGISLLLAILVWKGQAARLGWILVGLRLILTMAIALASSEWLPFTSHSSIMSYAMPFAWIFALRLAPEQTPKCPNIAPWVGLILVLQYLHAYPVAGSQIAWGTFLIIPLMALGLHDTQRFIRERSRPVYSIAVGTSCLALAAISTGRLSEIGWYRYTESHPLNLPGAEDLRPPENLASALRLLSLNATAHGDMLFSLPGLFSFNNWTQLPTPTSNNTTHWFSLLNLEQQEEISAALEKSKRPVLILHRGLIEFLTDNQFVISSPLHDYLIKNFARAFAVEKYEFWVRKERTIALLGSAEFLQLASPQPGLSANKLELIVAIPEGEEVAAIELVTLEETPRILSRWDKATGPLWSTAINLQGNTLSAEPSSGWERTLSPLARLELPLDKLAPFDRKSNIIYLRDKNGVRLAEARFID